tara:strand:+ start:3746 stop:4045 length:300 start_codon:yes stop_codon:yes gene_type:complete
MKPRHHKALSLRVIRLLNGWKDPHTDLPYTKTEAMQSIEIGETGIITMCITPHRPHCPCCLLDLRDLHRKVSSLKGVAGVKITIEGVPAAERWTREVNG